MTKDEMIAQQASIIAQQQKQIEELRREVAELKEKLNKNSNNSSKPGRQQTARQNRKQGVSQRNREEGWCAKGTYRAGVHADIASYGNSEP